MRAMRATAMYAQRLDGLCAMDVREARDDDRLQGGLVLIAPGPSVPAPTCWRSS